MHCNAGSTQTKLIGELGNMTVYHDPNSIVNVLLLKSVASKHRVTYDSHDRGGVFQVHTPNGVIEFLPSERGLHYLDMKEQGETIQHMLVTAEAIDDESESEDDPEPEECKSIEENDYMMVNTVQKNFEGYTKHDVKKAQEARCLQGMTGSPTDREFAGMVKEKLISNCPVTVHDVHNANRIFGPDLANKGGRRPGINRSM